MLAVAGGGGRGLCTVAREERRFCGRPSSALAVRPPPTYSPPPPSPPPTLQHGDECPLSLSAAPRQGKQHSQCTARTALLACNSVPPARSCLLRCLLPAGCSIAFCLPRACWLQVKAVDPYVVHLAWTYNGIAGKRSRLRDMGLWVDPPAYYGEGSFVTVDLQLPEVCGVGEVWGGGGWRGAGDRDRGAAQGRVSGVPGRMSRMWSCVWWPHFCSVSPPA